MARDRRDRRSRAARRQTLPDNPGDRPGEHEAAEEQIARDQLAYNDGYDAAIKKIYDVGMGVYANDKNDIQSRRAVRAFIENIRTLHLLETLQRRKTMSYRDELRQLALELRDRARTVDFANDPDGIEKSNKWNRQAEVVEFITDHPEELTRGQ